MNKIYDLFIVGMNIETFERKVYKGFDGEFDESEEIGYKYYLYFKTFYEQYYCVIMYTIQEINESNWIPFTKGCIEVGQINALPSMQYVISEPAEYINLNDYQIDKNITTSYLDFSKYGNEPNSPTGYVIINFNKFKNVSGNEDAVKSIEAKVTNAINVFYHESGEPKSSYQDIDNVLDNIFNNSDDIEWQHQCMIRKQGLYGANSSNEQISK